MKKAVYHGIRDVRVEQVEEPEPGPGEAKIRVVYCGICGSDLHEYLHGPFPRSPFGHEVCGEIVSTGTGTPSSWWRRRAGSSSSPRRSAGSERH
jgi:(R,R)-butanediol dehydrogenase/meso-butanediol dehydrogenase/diacetyl reductase